MANRSVSVRLTAEVSQYVRELDRAEKATDDLADEIDGLAKKGDLDGLAGNAEKAADGIDGMGTSADKAAGHVKTLDAEIAKTNQDLVFLHAQFAEAGDEGKRLDVSKEIEKTEAALRRLNRSRNALAGLIADPQEVREVAKAVDDIGDASTSTADRIALLDREISKARESLIALHAQFAITADEGRRLDISAEIQRTETGLSKLSKSRGVLASLLPNPGDVAKAGVDIGKMLSESIVGQVAKDPKLLAGIGAAVAVLAPFLGGVVSGAIVGGVGIGGIVGGVALAARDPRVAAAGKLLGAKMLGGLEADSKVLVGPLLKEIDGLGKRFDALRPRFKAIFANAGDLLGPVTDSLADGLEGLVNGVTMVMQRGGPAIEAFARLIGDTLDTIGRMFAILSGGSEEAADAIDVFSAYVQSSLTAMAIVIRGLTEAWGLMIAPIKLVVDAARALRGESENLSQWVDPATDSAGRLNGVLVGLTPTIGDAGVEAGSAATEFEKMAGAMRDATDSALDLYGAQIDLAQAIADAETKIAENGAGLDLSTKKGRENQKALEQIALAANKEYDAFVKVNGVGAESAARADEMRDAFIRMAVKAGYAADEAEELANKILAIPNKRETKLLLDNAAALRAAKALQDELNKIKSKTVRVHVERSTGEVTYGSGGGRQAPQGGRGAMGGPVRGPGPKGVDSVHMLLAPGEHIWTAAEVDAVGGHGAMAAMRASALTGGPSYSGAAGATLMRPQGGGTVRQIIEHRVVIEGKGALGRTVVEEMRNSTGLTAQVKQQLGLSVTG